MMQFCNVHVWNTSINLFIQKLMMQLVNSNTFWGSWIATSDDFIKYNVIRHHGHLGHYQVVNFPKVYGFKPCIFVHLNDF
jgi:hypothetical protein